MNDEEISRSSTCSRSRFLLSVLLVSSIFDKGYKIFLAKPWSWQIYCKNKQARPKILGGFKNEECRTSIIYHCGRSNSRCSSLGLFTAHDPRGRASKFVKQFQRSTRAVRVRKDCFGGEDFFHSHRGTIANSEPAAGSKHSQDHDLHDRQKYDHRRKPESWRQRRCNVSAGKRLQRCDQRARYFVIRGPTVRDCIWRYYANNFTNGSSEGWFYLPPLLGAEA